MATLKISPYLNIVLLNLHFLVLWDCRVQYFFLEEVALNPGLEGLRNVTSDIIAHEHNKTGSAVFKLWMLYNYFQMTFVSDYFDISVNLIYLQ